jgi:hypothetical protein
LTFNNPLTKYGGSDKKGEEETECQRKKKGRHKTKGTMQLKG